MNLIKGSYKDDCIFLLKDLTGKLEEISVEKKEELIREGISYSNFISKESSPSDELRLLFLKTLEREKLNLAKYIARVSESIYKQKGDNLVLVSLARAGTPYGILISKYLKYKYKVYIKHYSVSIIRGKGIDFNAIKYILEREKEGNIQFVDGWTGKGSIISELEKSIRKFNVINKSNVDSSLAVIADPAKLCSIYGTRKDISVPNSILNSTVSGLVSRTILNEDFIGEKDFHGAININYLLKEDFSQIYVDKIVGEFGNVLINEKDEFEEINENYSKDVVNKIKELYGVKNINNIKLSIGEATRVLLRRKPKLLLIKDYDDKNLQQLIILAKERNVKIEKLKFSDYKAAAIIEEKH